MHPTGIKDATMTAVAHFWAEHCLRASMGAREWKWTSVLQQLAPEASQCLPSRGMASASSGPWLMWHAYRPLKSFLTGGVMTYPALRLLHYAAGTPTKSTF